MSSGFSRSHTCDATFRGVKRSGQSLVWRFEPREGPFAGMELTQTTAVRPRQTVSRDAGSLPARGRRIARGLYVGSQCSLEVDVKDGRPRLVSVVPFSVN